MHKPIGNANTVDPKTAVRATAHFGFKVLRQLSRTFPEIQNPIKLRLYQAAPVSEPPGGRIFFSWVLSPVLG